MSFDDKELADDIGQMLIAGFHSTEPDDNIRKLIEVYRLGTVNLFARNIKDAEQLLKLTQSLQQIAKDAGHKQPLLISMDEENGIVQRIPGNDVPSMPGAMAIGASQNVENATKSYAMASKYMRFYGLQGNWAPVADVNSNPKNPVINVRSFGDDPAKVSEFAIKAAEAIHDGKVLSCLKHFPGHGDTAVDSHFGTAIVDKSMEELKKCELVPFVEGVKHNVDSMMMAHIIVPAMKSQLPASVSPENYRYLKETLGYKGLVVTDCLEMESISETFGSEKGAKMALMAGADAIMICHTFSRQSGGFKEMYDAVKNNEWSREKVKESVAKIRAIKNRLISWDEVLKPKSEKGFSKEQMAEDTAAMDRVYEECVTLVRGRAEEYLIKDGEKIGFAYVGESDSEYQNGAVQDSLKTNGIPPGYLESLQERNVKVEKAEFFPDTSLSKYDDVLKNCDKILLILYNVSINESQRRLAHHVAKLGKPVLTIATFSPYDFLSSKYATELPIYFTQFEPSVAAFKAILKVLFGEVKPRGVAPITIGSD